MNFLNSICPHLYLSIYQETFNNLILLIVYVLVIHGKNFAFILHCMAEEINNRKASGMDMKENTNIESATGSTSPMTRSAYLIT